MKRLIILAIVLTTVSVTAMAQTFTLGPKVGLNFSKLQDSGNAGVQYDYTKNWSGGLFARASFGKLYLQPEGYFNTVGTDLRIKSDPNNPNSNDVNGKVRLTSLDVPVLVGYKLAESKNKKSNFRIFGGPVATFILKERENDLRLLDDESYLFNKTNIGLQAGLGFDLANLTFDARYETGLNNINSYFNQRSNLFLFTVGFKIF